MEKLHLIFVLLCIIGTIYCRDWRVQRLNRFQEKYNNSEADIIFLLDVSGSVSNYGFNAEKEFIKSLLSHISVQPIATRVAVVTFGQDVQKNVDYIDYPYLDRDKCTFTKEFASVAHRYGPATNMNGALKQAKAILDGANGRNLKRKHVNTVAFLLTDGHWNYGGDPASTAQTLRDRTKYDVEIFSVGVGHISEWQLQSIAGSKDNVIIARDFSEFASLATRIRGDQIEKLYKSVDSSLCGIQCDPRAHCSCGTISGIYTCACPPGTYGSGLPGRCHACPRGTYKTYSSPDPCKPCPEKSITKNEGSTSVRDCECIPGFTGAPYAGESCQPLVCKSLPTTIPNGKVSDCGIYYGESCTFTCDRYHHVANEVATTRKLTCTLSNGGTWDKPLPQCVATKCQWPPNPSHMKLQCSGNGVGDKCVYTCIEGYVLVGANERECKEDGQWSHSLPFCQVITCPAVRKIDNVNINPVSCLTDSTNYNDGCAYSCKPGFKYVSGDQKRVCMSDGTWSGIELNCKDLTPPSITCPEHVTAETEPGQAFKEISYEAPTIRDNSISGWDEIRLLSEPASIKSPYEFPIGVTLINFTAIDASGNTDSCTFRVEILDREHPKFTHCPNDIPTMTDSASDLQKTVQWDMPTYSDNSGQTKVIYASHSNPSVFPVGPANRIQYTIEDPSKNRATCEFFIKVESKSCPKQDPPINGGSACKFVNGFGHYCTVNCQNPYDFNGPKAVGYVCTVSGAWATIPPAFPTKWPDCTAMQPQEGMGQNMKFFYYSGSCHDNIDARKQIADNFVKILDRVLRNEGGCSSAANARVCKGDNVQIKCGKLESVGGRRRRSVQNSLTIEVELEVLSKEDRAAQEKVVKALTSAVQNIKQQSSGEANQLKTIHLDGDTMILDRVEKVGSITGVCVKGMVFDKVDKTVGGKIKTEQTCVSCLAGNYFDTDTKECKKCPPGTYTEYPGLLGCSVCPLGKTTATEGTSNSTHCKAPCIPGMYSSTGLENCEACKKGFYQPKPYSKSCIRCPGSATTLGESATSLNQCGMVCPSGTYSKTGVEPCEPCAIGFYQPVTGSKQCIRCPDKLSTHAVGTSELTQCKAIDNCASKPCMNGGVCTNEFNEFSCVCKHGYYGDRCQDEKNECRDNPCYGDAKCIDKVNGFVCVCPPNYYGKFCSDRKSTCDSSTCQNGGTCLDRPNGVSCSCTPGWQGNFCERTIDECASSPCLNDATCVDSHRGFTCKCKQGFTGALCDKNIDNCKQNNLCLNGGSCIDGVNSFTCSCRQGYAGSRCEININECASNPCRNGGLCVDEINGFKCKCATTFVGTICDKRLTTSNFDLVFNRAKQGYAKSTFHKDINEVTVAFWVKASSNDIESGTVLSYAVGNDAKTMDNALVFRDIHHMLFVVLGEEVETNITAADDQWHHVAVTWSGNTGVYKAYIDGLKIIDGASLKTGRYIPAGGVFILGQEQDEVGRNFSASEALDGSLSQLNVWDYVLSESEILTLSSYRCDKIAGNVIAWADFYDKISDQVEREVKFCQVQNTKFMSWVSSTSTVPKNVISAQCATNDNKNIKELNLIRVSCTTNGFSCKDADQTSYDPNNPTKCPSSVKIRYEQLFSKASSCNSQSCSGNGKCEETLSGFVCLCNDGYTGKNCQNEVLCESIQSFPNGYVTTSGNKIFKFTCNAGYDLVGLSTLHCSAGRLNKDIPKCVDINECSTSNGNCAHLCVNTEGSFHCECNNGFTKSGFLCIDEDECKSDSNCQDGCVNTYGSYKCKCRAGYRLAADERSCEDIDECKIKTHNCQQICVNTLSSYTCLCRPGFYLSTDKTTCIPVACPSVLAPSHGSVSQGYGTYQTTITYSCNRNYRLDGPTVRICDADGKWSGTEPICIDVICPPLSSPYNGQAYATGEGEDNVYKFSCLTGFMMIGDATRNCQKDGTWSGIQPRCIPYHCSPIAPPTNGLIIGSSHILDATIIIKCNEGYMLEHKDNNYRTCQQNKQWSGKDSRCIQVNCGKPENIENGTISGNSFNYNDEIKYSCKDGFGLTGPPIRICQLNGEWSGVKPTCLWNSCGYPGSPRNGAVVGNDYSFGRSVSYRCGAEFRLIGDQERKCLLSGRWTGSVPICQEITCADPTVPSNGERNGDKFTVNSKVYYDCLPGFSLIGERSLICGMNGQWSSVAPTCEAGVCGSPKLVGPEGIISSPNYPNSYSNNGYCRWNINVATNKQARLVISSLKMADSEDRLELLDGKDGNLLAILTGALPNPVTITSSSNIMDVRFVSNKENVADGFTAVYEGAICGGQITSFGSVIQTPNYPSNYPSGVVCTWQIYMPGERFKVKFERFNTANSFDKLQAWRSFSILTSGTEIGAYYGNLGTLLTIDSYEILYLRFSSDDTGRTAPGFRATLIKNTDITL